MTSTTLENTDNKKIESVLVGQIPYIRRYARALTRNAADADDLVQTCLMRAIVNMDRFEQGTNLRAWLLTIMHNVFIDGVRKVKRARDADESAESMMSGLYTRPNQVESLQLGDLQNAMEQLPEEQRTTLILVALEDMSYEEAAQVTGVPVGTVRSRLSRARHSLMRMVDGLTMDDVSPQAGITRKRKNESIGRRSVAMLRDKSHSSDAHHRRHVA
ncbi:MAG TPA: sigma-70 family RNA polymerase sigma factor [Alphaproteobacteria bacterium]|nr:sigma-70 family RNA polymerase sigma factor [Alphaproteobacteria bacterium]